MGHPVWKRGGSPHQGEADVVTLSIVGVGVGACMTLSGRGGGVNSSWSKVDDSSLPCGQDHAHE